MGDDNNFEKKLERIEGIINMLEENKINLKDSTSLFEEGIKLIDLCEKELDMTEDKIKKLVSINEEISEEDFNIEME
ncbi:MAG: exodeoxyribonuclease VII small subunit [Eubacteriaceae bacterium]